VFISYAHDDPQHEQAVRQLWGALRRVGIDAKLDMLAAQRPQDWPLWMMGEVRAADFVLVVASPAYKQRAEGDAGPGVGLGVQWEARLIREEVYSDQVAAGGRFLPVVLPGRSVAEIPTWLGPNSHTHYRVTGFDLSGFEDLYRYLTGQPAELAPPLGSVVRLPPHGLAGAAAAPPDPGRRPAALRTQVDIDVTVRDQHLRCATVIAGTPMGVVEGPLPQSLRHPWAALSQPVGLAEESLARAGRGLCEVLFSAEAATVLAELVTRLGPGDGLDLVLTGPD
jgi:hypothetical protein